MSCRKHHKIIESNNYIWEKQMIKLFPAFGECCKNNRTINYKGIVKEIISISYDEFINISLYFFKNISLSKIFGSSLMYKYDYYPHIISLLRKYLINNLTIFDEIILENVFINCCYNNDIEVAVVLLNYLKKINKFTRIEEYHFVFYVTCSRGYIEIAKLLLDFQNDLKNYYQPQIFQYSRKLYNQVFISACIFGRIPIVKLLLEYCRKYPGFINIGYRDNDALIGACIHGRTSVVELLLEFSKDHPGAIDINAQNGEEFKRASNNKEILKLLHKGSALINLE
jgi:hypothetical protein